MTDETCLDPWEISKQSLNAEANMIVKERLSKSKSLLMSCSMCRCTGIASPSASSPKAEADVFADESCTPLLAEGERIAYEVCLRQTSILESVPTGLTWFWQE
ncbi:hypothetical protein GRJ2_000356000 [Grus japonensis]|uniref:Uncharacterized protein n=1 Tax=Grus japonensis TaxID=30415 RepID=A0ABC9W1P0_GRUJA